ncbi:PPM-type phosphatase domain-containing protein [Balamuthia mandrillaris]
MKLVRPGGTEPGFAKRIQAFGVFSLEGERHKNEDRWVTFKQILDEGLPEPSLGSVEITEASSPEEKEEKGSPTVPAKASSEGQGSSSDEEGAPSGGEVCSSSYPGRFNPSYFAVYDGHGGRMAADFVRVHLHAQIINQQTSNLFWPQSSAAVDEKKISGVVLAAFALTEQKLINYTIKKKNLSGCCAIVVMQVYDRILVANLGDSRVVQGRKAENPGVGKMRVPFPLTYKAVPLSEDQKASHPVERRRINKQGGFVSGGRALGMLAVGRSFGDRFIKNPPSPAGTKRKESPDGSTKNNETTNNADSNNESKKQNRSRSNSNKIGGDAEETNGSKEAAGEEEAGKKGSNKEVATKKKSTKKKSQEPEAEEEKENPKVGAAAKKNGKTAGDGAAAGPKEGNNKAPKKSNNNVDKTNADKKVKNEKEDEPAGTNSEVTEPAKKETKKEQRERERREKYEARRQKEREKRIQQRIAMWRKMKEQGGANAGEGAVIAEPELRFFKIKPKDHFIIIASDGFWDVFTNKKAVDTVAKLLKEEKEKLLKKKEGIESQDAAQEDGEQSEKKQPQAEPSETNTNNGKSSRHSKASEGDIILSAEERYRKERLRKYSFAATDRDYLFEDDPSPTLLSAQEGDKENLTSSKEIGTRTMQEATNGSPKETGGDSDGEEDEEDEPFVPPKQSDIFLNRVCQVLCEKAKNKGSRDDITVILVLFDEIGL